MEFKKKTLETQIIEIFQKISPAITRLIQSETDNANIVINLGKTCLLYTSPSPRD